jgi:16S rRNA (uracil1498-N3)-methyltransferase
MSERFYLNWPLQPGPATLEGPEAHHLAAVCRLRPGDAICLFNGDGHEYSAHIVAVQRQHVEVEILERRTPSRELPFCLEVAAPLPKGDRTQFLVEKLTELGVTCFVPLATRRSVGHPRQAKPDKLQRYVIEASKQCGRNVLMEVRAMAAWSDYCRRGDLPPQRFLGHPGGTVRLAEIVGSASDVACAVGPEGGFADDEIEAALAASWLLVDLGPRILRVETAATIMAGLCGLSKAQVEA